jgi:hypothetical protein
VKRLVLATTILIAFAVCGSCAERKVSLDELKDHISGGWVGQGVGVTFGDKYEFRTCGAMVEGELRAWEPDFLERSLGQDDMYVDMTFVGALEAYGPKITMEQAGCAFGATTYPLWHANKSGRENVRNGIMPPWSGNPKYNIHADDIDFEIECDGIGMVCPGLPQKCNNLCDVFGHIMNYGDGVYAGMWIAGMYTQAFFESDVNKIVAQGLKCVPPESRFARCISDVIAWHAKYPNDWAKTWTEVENKYQDDVDCEPGKKLNIDAVLNSAYVAIGLLYGGGDMDKTMQMAVRCGQDSDCNPSSACGVLGCSIGLSRLDDKYKSYLPKLAGRNFAHTNYSYDTITKACLNVATQVIEQAGGKIVEENGQRYAIIPVQEPIPPMTLEQWPEESQKRMLGIGG